MLHKKIYLEKLIESGKIKNFSIAGKPTKEIQEAFTKGEGFIHIFKKYGIESRLNKFGGSLISIYIPTWTENGKRKALLETCLINFNLKDVISNNDTDEGLEIMTLDNAISEMNKVIKNLLDEVYAYYQVSLTPVDFLKILNIEGGYGECLTFEDILRIIPVNQTKLSEKIGVNKSTISDYKAVRATPSLKVISKLINLYPLLPWDEYIEGISNEENK